MRTAVIVSGIVLTVITISVCTNAEAQQEEVRVRGYGVEQKKSEPPKEKTTQEKLTDAYQAAREEIQEAAAKVVKTVGKMQDERLEKKIERLLDAVHKNPENFTIHVDLCDALIARINHLIDVNRSAMQMDLVEKRDKIVNILNELATSMDQRANLTIRKARSAKGAVKASYESLAESEQRFSRGYKRRATEFSAIKIDKSIEQVTSNIEYLVHVRGSLEAIRPALSSILTDVTTLKDFKQMSLKLDEIQMAIEQFSQAVNEGFLLRKAEANEKTTS